jgi:hypothetical protein
LDAAARLALDTAEVLALPADDETNKAGLDLDCFGAVISTTAVVPEWGAVASITGGECPAPGVGGVGAIATTTTTAVVATLTAVTFLAALVAVGVDVTTVGVPAGGRRSGARAAIVSSGVGSTRGLVGVDDGSVI